jgi:voltage-gated potassium channel
LKADGENARLLQHALRAAGALAALLGLGTLGYVVIEGWSAFDAFYMTVITLATIGYGETHPLSEAGRLFTVLLIFVGVGNLAYAFGGTTGFLAAGGLEAWRRRSRLENTLNTITGHTIVCGCGRLGSAVTRALLRQGASVVVVDRDGHALRRFLTEHPELPHVVGDAAEDEVLLEAGARRANALVAALNDDASNVFLTLSARVLNARLVIYGKADDPSTLQKLERAGANVQFSPAHVAGTRIANQILRPGLTEVIGFASESEPDELGIEEVSPTQLGLQGGRTLGDTPVWGKADLLVLGVRRIDGHLVFPPRPEIVLGPEDRVLVMGRPASLTAVLGIDVTTAR